jgi:threonylcarbamoyladenosine tRNA methylthiotransferase MtaB
MAPSAPEKEDVGRPRRVAFFTLGCKVNQQETAALQELFRERGYEIVGFDSPAEVYIINTCTVTHLADHKSRQMIRRAVRRPCPADADGPPTQEARGGAAVTAVVGCYAQTAPEEVLSLGVDVLVGTQDRGRIVDLVEQAARDQGSEARGRRPEESEKHMGKNLTPGLRPPACVPACFQPEAKPQSRPSDSGAAPSTDTAGDTPVTARHRCGAALSIVSPLSEAAGFEELPIPRPRNRTRAFLKIEDGCDQYCSYCIVPFARGPVRSLRPELALRRLEELLAAGFREVVLTGVHTSAYGRDLADGVNLASLLRLLLQLPGEFRLRLSSVEPAEAPDELLDVLASPRICRHLHLPLQSGDDEILALMGRSYRAADYGDLFHRVHERLPGVAVAADVIVGFPGETDLRFENTHRFIASLPFRDLHVFKYSPRPGTRAAELPGQVTPAAKDERSSRLRRLADEQAAAFATRFIGQTLPVLVERRARPAPERRDCWEGLSDNYLRIVFPAPADSTSTDLQGSLVQVRALKRLEGDTLYGETVDY